CSDEMNSGPYSIRVRSASLQARFPTARVLQMDAAQLAHADIFEGEPVGAVVSGLPLLSMSPRKIASILAGAFAYMRPGG
ncbi:hypothetical protein AB9F39_38495, partial [Rhizobium leguminosarum]